MASKRKYSESNSNPTEGKENMKRLLGSNDTEDGEDKAALEGEEPSTSTQSGRDTKEPYGAGTSPQLPGTSCAPISAPWPTTFYHGGVVFHYGTQLSHPIQPKADVELMPPSETNTVLKVVELKELVKLIPPRPRDESEAPEWLQQWSEIVGRQLLILIMTSSAEPPTAGKSGIIVGAPQSASQVAYLFRHGDVEASMDRYIDKYGDSKAKSLRSMWEELYGPYVEKHLNRKLKLASFPVGWKYGPPRFLGPRVQPLRLRLRTVVCRLFCTLQMSRAVDLEVAARSLSNAVYQSRLGVVELQYEAPQRGWLWANGTVMIINVQSEATLNKNLRDVVSRAMGIDDFSLDPRQKLHLVRLYSKTRFPWEVSLRGFSRVQAPTSGPILPRTEVVHYVSKNMPGVSARVFRSGECHTLASTTAQADKMMRHLYMLTAIYQKYF
ncbi:uncharacterized protein LOC127010713 [Drosophila biarmipes]|uniref:uncharacterized protein LOC127010713 n=1 Tax=Drosophila biarmipes TaxID=125945 RepID=UPI0007E68F9A|nr:uncharacterized protein LOC127010713 [Drosophila biarmipes]